MVDGDPRRDAAGGIMTSSAVASTAIDRRWLVPHFEKMLYDNALLAACATSMPEVTGDDGYRQVAEETVGYVLRELRLGRRARVGPGRRHRRSRGIDVHLDQRRACLGPCCTPSSTDARSSGESSSPL